MVPASGALRGAGVSPLQRGVARPEEERRRAQEGLRHLQSSQRAGGVPGEAEWSDPAVHFPLRCELKESEMVLASDVTLILLVTDASSTAAGILHQCALSVSLGGLT